MKIVFYNTGSISGLGQIVCRVLSAEHLMCTKSPHPLQKTACEEGFTVFPQMLHSPSDIRGA